MMIDVKIPDEMTAVMLESYSGADALRVVQRPVPRPGANEVLVQVAASPINPSDLSFLEGNYGFKKPLPTVPGFEGSGVVVAAGGGLMGRYLVGKRVACISQREGDGVWAEYALVAANYALPLASGVSLEQGSMSVVNPLTAVALIDIAKKGKHKTIVNTAAASALGQMLNRLGQQAGIQVINVVRRDAQVSFLRQQGAAFVLNSSDADFDQQLFDLCHQQQTRLAFDAIGGRTTWQLLDAMPRHSKVTIYGGLAAQPVQLLPGHAIFQDKVVDGFWLTAWLREKNFVQSLLLWRQAQGLLSSSLKTEIRGRYPLTAVHQAVTTYQNQMTGGKTLIVPNQEPG